MTRGSYGTSGEDRVTVPTRLKIGLRTKRNWLGQVAGVTKLSPPETTLGDEVLKLALHETNERVYAIVETETARSALFARYLPPDPGVVRLDSGVGGQLSAIRTFGDPFQLKR